MSDDRSYRIGLLLDPDTRIEDPGDPSTWRIAGRPPTPAQFAALSQLTQADLDDAVSVLRLWAELGRAERRNVRDQ